MRVNDLVLWAASELIGVARPGYGYVRSGGIEPMHEMRLREWNGMDKCHSIDWIGLDWIGCRFLPVCSGLVVCSCSCGSGCVSAGRIQGIIYG